MGDNILHFIFISILLNPRTYVLLGYFFAFCIIGYLIFVVIGIVSWIIRLVTFIYKFIIGVLQFIGVVKKNNYKYATGNHNFSNKLGEGRIVDLGEHIGVLAKISKKQIAEEYLKEQKTNSKKKQDDYNGQQKDKSYSESMADAMDQEAQAKGWN